MNSNQKKNLRSQKTGSMQKKSNKQCKPNRNKNQSNLQVGVASFICIILLPLLRCCGVIWLWLPLLAPLVSVLVSMEMARDLGDGVFCCCCKQLFLTHAGKHDTVCFFLMGLYTEKMEHLFRGAEISKFFLIYKGH